MLPPGWDTVTVQLPDAPDAITVGVQFKEEMLTGRIVRVNCFELLPSAAVTMAVPDVEVSFRTVKIADMDPAGTSTVAGAVTPGILTLRFTVTPGAGATLESSTVQADEPPAPTLAGEQVRV
jgi:hypothetical protein